MGQRGDDKQDHIVSWDAEVAWGHTKGRRVHSLPAEESRHRLSFVITKRPAAPQASHKSQLVANLMGGCPPKLCGALGQPGADITWLRQLQASGSSIRSSPRAFG